MDNDVDEGSLRYFGDPSRQTKPNVPVSYRTRYIPVELYTWYRTSTPTKSKRDAMRWKIRGSLAEEIPS